MKVKTFALLLALLAASAPPCAAATAHHHGSAAQKRRRPARTSTRARPGKVMQEEVVRFPRRGDVRVRAVEARGRLPRLEFASPRTGRTFSTITLGTSEPETFKPTLEPGVSPIEPFARFMPLTVDGLPSPLLLAVAVRPGGSDHGFLTTLVGETRDGLKSLMTEPIWTPIQGGVYVGDLGGARGHGLAVWEFIWGDDEAHYAEHLYAVRLYKYDPRVSTFRRVDVLRSKQKHKSGEDALEELKLPRYTNLLDNFPAIKEYRN